VINDKDFLASLIVSLCRSIKIKFHPHKFKYLKRWYPTSHSIKAKQKKAVETKGGKEERTGKGAQTAS